MLASLLAALVLSGAAVRVAAAAESVDSLNPLFQALPAAKFVPVDWERLKAPDQPLSRVRGVFLGRSDQGAWLGSVIHLSSPGYGGPIEILAAFDPAGSILRVIVFRHQETDCHVKGMTNGTFLQQFVGVSLVDQLKLLVGLARQQSGDIQAMTGGTITSRAVTEAVAEARVVFYRLWGPRLR